MNKERKKEVYVEDFGLIISEASIPEFTVIPMSAVFSLVTDASRSAEAGADAANSGSIFHKKVKISLKKILASPVTEQNMYRKVSEASIGDYENVT